MPEQPSSHEGVEQVRSNLKDLLHPRFDTDFNILRWLQGANHNVPKATHMLRKHLKWRREKKLDTDSPELQECTISQEHSPLSIVGPAGPNSDRLIVVDQAGKIDISGVMKSVVPTEYLHQLYRNMERILALLNDMESKLGRQCSVYYVFDLDGLHFDPTMLGTVTGPFRIGWELIALHYREWIDKFIVINAPGFVNVLWSAIAPFIQEEGRKKILFPGKTWKEELLTICEPSHLPERYGGTLPDSLVLKDPKPVPKEKFWSPRLGDPHPNSLHKISIPASKTRVLFYECPVGQRLNIYTQNETEVHIGLYFGGSTDLPEEELDAAVPWCPRTGLPAVDLIQTEPSEDGIYQFRIGNQASWMFSSTFKILVLDNEGKEVRALNQDEKWIKLGQKLKK